MLADKLKKIFLMKIVFTFLKCSNWADSTAIEINISGSKLETVPIKDSSFQFQMAYNFASIAMRLCVI